MAQEQNNQNEEIEFKADNTHIDEELKEIANEIENHQPTATNEESVSEEEKVKAELASVQDKYLRLYSEFENYKRRTTKERSDLFKTANQEMVLAMIPVLDDFERALQAMVTSEENKTIKEGVDLIYNKLKSTLTQKGLKEMEAEGKPFDVEFHEAITKIPAPSEELKDKIVAVLEKGYFLHDKVIRFAKVIIGE
ncbi:MAG: nucleotide exchange factor GrpE [Bacteroidia bacterium]|nr:nucleotide exchange factor GrpE [Bacteroidia bacterium]MCF8426198.1 nucleotide exchange factor GrpE [Bacteroidia bacterium]MCF8446260.1 nucleotide exchange factor GrpE [Bacteroidia bacterium]